MAIVLVVLVGWLVVLSLHLDSWVRADLLYVISAALIAGVSWMDDLRSLPNRVRFAAHSLGAILVLLGIGHWGVVDSPCSAPCRWVGLG